MDEKTHQSRLFLTGIFTIGAVIVVLFLIILYSGQSKKPTDLFNTAKYTADTPQSSTASGARYELKSSKTAYNVGDKIELIVSANTGKEAVVGYDVALKIGPQLEYVKSENMVSSFDLYDTAKEGRVIITGAKRLGGEQAVIFSDTDIIKLYLKAVKKGRVNIEFDFKKGSVSDSNLMNEKNEDLLRKAKGLTLTVL